MASKENSVQNLSVSSVSINSLIQELYVVEEVDNNIELVPDSESYSDQSSKEEHKRFDFKFKSLSIKKPMVLVKRRRTVKSDEKIPLNQLLPLGNLNNSWPEESKGSPPNLVYPTIELFSDTDSSDMLKSGSSLASGSRITYSHPSSR